VFVFKFHFAFSLSLSHRDPCLIEAQKLSTAFLFNEVAQVGLELLILESGKSLCVYCVFFFLFGCWTLCEALWDWVEPVSVCTVVNLW